MNVFTKYFMSNALSNTTLKLFCLSPLLKKDNKK